MLTGGAHRGFAAIRDQWRRIMLLGSKRNRNASRKIRKPHQRSNPKPIRRVFLTKTENQMPKNRKSVNHNEHAIRTEPKFFGKKTDLEKISKIVMPPLRMKQSVQSTNQTNDDTTTIIIAETSTKTFLLLLVLNQKHAAKQL